MIYILHYNKDELTNACAFEWAKQGTVCVIDNGSTIPFRFDDRWRNTASLAFCRYLPINLHLIEAFNNAMRVNRANWYLCLNNDVFPCGNVVERLLAIFSDPDVGIAAPGSSDPAAGILYVPESEIGHCLDIETRHVDNHALFFTQDVLDEIGYPDADGHTHRANWYANKEYCYRARMANFKVIAARSVYVDHRRDHGYDPIADQAGQDWLKQRLGERFAEAW